MGVVEQVKGVLNTFFCLSKIIPRLEKSATQSLFIVNYEFYSLYLYTTANSAAIHSHSATKMVHRNLHDIKYTKLYWGTWSKEQYD
jgi:hypothetical protein